MPCHIFPKLCKSSKFQLFIFQNFHDAWYNKGTALFHLGRKEEAIAAYDKTLEIKPDFHDAWNNKGTALSDLGRQEEAIAAYDKALETAERMKSTHVDKIRKTIAEIKNSPN